MVFSVFINYDILTSQNICYNENGVFNRKWIRHILVNRGKTGTDIALKKLNDGISLFTFKYSEYPIYQCVIQFRYLSFIITNGN